MDVVAGIIDRVSGGFICLSFLNKLLYRNKINKLAKFYIMAEFKIDGRMTVRTLKENFKNTFEGTLRVYDGREKADDNATLASIRKNDVKTGEYVCRGSRTVGKFIKEMEEVFGISIKVASPDDWVLALDGITLANLKNIKKNATKADMEELVAYKRKGEEMDEEDYDDDYDDDDENDKFEIKDGVCIIPEGTTEIGDYAFNSCDELTSIVIPNSVTSIGECAFEGCIGLTSIEIPNSVTKIDYSAFQDCNGLTSVVIPNSVTEIGDSAFDGCWELTSIEIPDSVTKIGRRAFLYCEGLTNIKVAEGNPVYDSRGGCNAIIETESNKLLEGCQSTVIPDSVTEIGGSAFHGRTVLTSIEIPDSVTEIGECAFQGCTRLTSVEISDSVTEIGCYAFACCGLINIVIPDSVTNIGGSAFKNCTGLTNVEIHSSEIEFGRGVFSDCKNLKSIKVPSNTADYFKEILPEELHDLIVEMEPEKKTKKK